MRQKSSILFSTCHFIGLLDKDSSDIEDCQRAARFTHRSPNNWFGVGFFPGDSLCNIFVWGRRRLLVWLDMSWRKIVLGFANFHSFSRFLLCFLRDVVPFRFDICMIFLSYLIFHRFVQPKRNSGMLCRLTSWSAIAIEPCVWDFENRRASTAQVLVQVPLFCFLN